MRRSEAWHALLRTQCSAQAHMADVSTVCRGLMYGTDSYTVYTTDVYTTDEGTMLVTTRFQQ